MSREQKGVGHHGALPSLLSCIFMKLLAKKRESEAFKINLCEAH